MLLKHVFRLTVKKIYNKARCVDSMSNTLNLINAHHVHRPMAWMLHISFSPLNQGHNHLLKLILNITFPQALFNGPKFIKHIFWAFLALCPPFA